MPRIALGIEYDGSAFAGWQSQTHAHGIQTVVEAAVAHVANHPAEVVAAGRTDAGVHAASQVVHFDSHAIRSERSWVLGANSELPRQVSVLWAREVPDSFHARYSAVARSYQYFILNRGVRAALGSQQVTWIREPLDHERMHVAAQQLVGSHDFSSFRAAECQSRSPVRQLHRIDVTRRGDSIAIAVTANAFLHHMVRNIAGVLIAVGCGDRPVEWVGEVLAVRDRRRGGVTAPPNGLYLTGIQYPSELQLPSEVREVLGLACPVRPDQV
ncbi:MAG TPA: tRNA pseudouridine(38-40) synthase TruA [Povalibacter sp.]